MTLKNFLIIAVVSYLVGSLSSSIIVSKLTMHQDIRDYGSGNAGLTNSYRTMGGARTLLVLLGDIGKAVIAVMLGGTLAGQLGKLCGGLFVMLGHCFPLYFGFRGGKGVLVGATMLAIFDWRIFAIAFSLFVICVVLTKWVSLGSIVGAISFPVTTAIFYQDTFLTIVTAALAAAVIAFHKDNIVRMVHGTESKFSFKSQKTMEHKENSEKQEADK